VSLCRAGLVQAHVKARDREGRGIWLPSSSLQPGPLPRPLGERPREDYEGLQGTSVRLLLWTLPGGELPVSPPAGHGTGHSCEWAAGRARHGLLLGQKPGSCSIPGCEGPHWAGGRFGIPGWSCLFWLPLK
jgi:hypothetical protein